MCGEYTVSVHATECTWTCEHTQPTANPMRLNNDCLARHSCLQSIKAANKKTSACNVNNCSQIRKGAAETLVDVLSSANKRKLDV